MPRHNHNHDQRDKSNVMCYLIAKYSSTGKYSVAAGLYFLVALSTPLFLSVSVTLHSLLVSSVCVAVCICVSTYVCPCVCIFKGVLADWEL